MSVNLTRQSGRDRKGAAMSEGKGTAAGRSRLIWIAALLAPVTAARAEPGAITWTTYLYQGPSTHYQVADEVNQLQRVDILGCADGWCHVSFGGRSGYVLAEVVVHQGRDAAAPPAGVLGQPAATIDPTPRGPCFVANQKAGNGGNELTRFCEK